jgi:PTS system beta-glucosides-specific IIC component
VLIAVGASRRFGSNVYVAAAMGAAVVGVQWLQMLRVSGSGESLPADSALPSGFWIGIVPLIFMFWVLSRLERWLDGRLNDRIRLVAKPVICLFVFFPVAYVVMVLVSSGLSFAALSFAQFVLSPLWIDVPVAYAAFAGLLWPILSAFGLEIMLFPMHDFLALGGPDHWWALAALAAAIMGQAGAAMGVLVRSRNRDLRRLAGVSVLAGFAGEFVPAMYGVTLRLKIPFVIGCIAGSAGAVIMVTSGALPELSAQILQISNPEGSASGSIPGLLSLAGSAEGTTALLGLSLGMLVSFVAAFVLVAAFGFKDPQGDLRTNTPSSTTLRQLTQAAYDDLLADTAIHTVLAAPLDGTVIPLDRLADPDFESGIVGEGVAIDPTSSRVLSPVAGRVSWVSAAGNAVRLESTDGLEILIQVGERGEPDPSHFSRSVAQGQPVALEDPLLEFDAEAIQDAGGSLITLIVVTNLGDHAGFVPRPSSRARAAHDLGVVVRGNPVRS